MKKAYFWGIAVGLLCGMAHGLGGCKPNTPPDSTEPTPTTPTVPGSTLGSQKDIIEALRPVSARRITMSEIHDDSVRTYWRGKLICASLESESGVHLIPIRDFYQEYDNLEKKDTVVYWVPGKQRILINKIPVPDPIVLLGSTGYITPFSIMATNSKIKIAATEEGSIEFMQN